MLKKLKSHKWNLITNIIFIATICFLCWKIERLEDRISNNMRLGVSNAGMVSEMTLFMQQFVEMAPEEMERIARDVINDRAQGQ